MGICPLFRVMRVLNVAEKPSVAKEVSRILSHNNASSTQSCAQYVRNWQFDGVAVGGQQSCQMVFTAVVGHLMELDFGGAHRRWRDCDPDALFHAPVYKSVPQSKKQIAQNLGQLARSCQWLILWLDCDREGENIAFEVRSVCLDANPQIAIKRARFSALTATDLQHAINNLRVPNERDSLAVDARQEIDLRAGAAFTRFQTMLLQRKFDWSSNGLSVELGSNLLLSYGPCQFPTLGLICLAREIEAHVEEPFWHIHVAHEIPSERASCEFEWSRHRLFDKFVADVLFSFCNETKTATVTKVDSREKRKCAPCPLSTLELQKGATAALRIPGERIMKYAEELYNAGFISYPRTETDNFPQSMDVRQYVAQQQNDNRWGEHASAIVSGDMWKTPRNGGHDDQAHPPIHPLKAATGESSWDASKARVYEFIVRSFLACCSKDAVGFETSVEIDIAGESFTTKGLVILERNWLDVYPYTKWGGNSNLPNFSVGQGFTPKELVLKEGRTQPPHRLTERDLIEKMERFGIGTDATVAEHIQKQIDRGCSTPLSDIRDCYALKNAQLQFSATALGEGLILSYCNMGLDNLWKPDLRGKIEQSIKDVSIGAKTKEEVLQIAVSAFHADFQCAQQKSDVMIEAMSRYFRRTDAANVPAAPLYQAQSATMPIRGRGRGRGGTGRRARGRGRGRGGRATAPVGATAPLCPMHNLPMLALTSNTAQNPGRVFYKCSNESERDSCLPFKWADEFGSGDVGFHPGTAPERGRRGRGRRGRSGR